MKTWAQTAFLFVIVFSLAYCTTTSVTPVESAKAQGYDKLLDRFYIMVDTSDVKIEVWTPATTKTGSPTYKTVVLGEYLTEAMPKTMSDAGVQAVAKRLTGLEFDAQGSNGAALSAAKDADAKGLMVVALGDGTVNGSNELVRGTLLLSIVDIDSNRTVWKAKAKIEGAVDYAYSWEGRNLPIHADAVDKAMAGVLSAMRSDGIILSPLGPQGQNSK